MLHQRVCLLLREPGALPGALLGGRSVGTWGGSGLVRRCEGPCASGAPGRGGPGDRAEPPFVATHPVCPGTSRAVETRGKSLPGRRLLPALWALGRAPRRLGPHPVAPSGLQEAGVYLSIGYDRCNRMRQCARDQEPHSRACLRLCQGPSLGQRRAALSSLGGGLRALGSRLLASGEAQRWLPGVTVLSRWRSQWMEPR